MTDISYLVSEAHKAEPFKHHTDPVRPRKRGIFASFFSFIASL